MSRLIESIKIEKHEVALMKWHQKRMDASLQKLGFKNPHVLSELFKGIETTEAVYKWRLVYDEKQIYHNQILPYEILVLKDFELVEISEFDYSLKWENRFFFEELKNESKASDLIMCQGNQVLECTFANLVFLKSSQKITPKRTLLNGVQRQNLLEKKIITEQEIRVSDLQEFESFQLINAMIDLEKSPIYPITCILGL